jgi:putative oxidoreductase
METTTITTAPESPSKGLNIALWIVQILLAALFIMAGIMKVTTPIDELGAKMDWVKKMPGLVRFIGVAELLGAIGIILPSLIRILPKLTVYAAIGLALIMILATGYHIARGEAQHTPMTLLFTILALFVAWGRSKKVVIKAK